MNRNEFLDAVVRYVESDPESAPYIAQACSAGVGRALKEALERACDMECACAVLVVNRKDQWARDTLRQKLEKWNGKLSLRWDTFLKGKR